jgi:uncharacterized membrane protein YjgN (DUF898 family)
MSNTNAPTTHRFSFHGSGSELFGQFLVNWLLIIVTLGIYYPWAKAKLNRYYYQHTEFSGHSFQYHGTGMEMFVGFIKAFLIMAGVGVTAALAGMAAGPVAGIICFYLMLIGLIPFAMVGSLQYTCSRSSWRNVHFGYNGTAGSMATIYLPGIFLTIISLGFYSPWLMASLKREITGNTRFGSNIDFEYHGTGGELFKKVIVGYLLSIFTLGIYSFWMAADLFNYSYNQTHIYQSGRHGQFQATVTGGGIFKMFVVDLVLLVLSLGIATPWLIVRNIKYVADNLSIEGDIDTDAIEAGEAVYATATGEALTEAMS